MEKKFAYLIVLGLVIGALFGIFYGKALENAALGIVFGASGGVFLGWFAAIIAQDRYHKKGQSNGKSED
jgi:hypothetical protein